MNTKIFNLFVCVLILIFSFSRVDASMILVAPSQEDMLLAEASSSFIATFQIGDSIAPGFGGGTERGMILSGKDADAKYCGENHASCFVWGATFTFIAKSSGFEIEIGDSDEVLDFIPKWSTDRLLLFINATILDTNIVVKDLVFNGTHIPNMSSDANCGYVWEIKNIPKFGQSEPGDIISGRIQMFKTGAIVPINDDLIFKIVGIGDGSTHMPEPIMPEPSTLIILTVGLFIIQRAHKGLR
ncbi:hypothetical protein KJ786_03625 [Patescibacteria group bacterium]|nr:hypothetical protein [Patescibacteria group bacterium]